MDNNQDQPNNAVLANTLIFIQQDLKVIKSDVKEIKNDTLSRREFNLQHSEVERVLNIHDKKIEDILLFISNLKGKYAILAVIGMAVVGILGSLITNSIIEKTHTTCPINLICTTK